MISYPQDGRFLFLVLLLPLFRFQSSSTNSWFFLASTFRPRNRISSGFVYKLSRKLRNLLTRPPTWSEWIKSHRLSWSNGRDIVKGFSRRRNAKEWASQSQQQLFNYTFCAPRQMKHSFGKFIWGHFWKLHQTETVANVEIVMLSLCSSGWCGATKATSLKLWIRICESGWVMRNLNALRAVLDGWELKMGMLGSDFSGR